MSQDLDRARAYLSALQLPAPRLGATSFTAPPIDFDAARRQALVVGSEVVSFVQGITAEQRSDIVNAVQLAQLAAHKVVPEPRKLEDVRAWYGKYFDVLRNVGFNVQQSGLQQYTAKSDGFQAHEAALEVAATLLTGSPTALAVLTSTVHALQKADASSPWLTVFNREARSANTAHFQVSTADRDPNGDLFVVLAAFAMEAKQKITQVLLFKFGKTALRIENHAGKASINAPLLAKLRPVVSQKLAAGAQDFVRDLAI